MKTEQNVELLINQHEFTQALKKFTTEPWISKAINNAEVNLDTKYLYTVDLKDAFVLFRYEHCENESLLSNISVVGKNEYRQSICSMILEPIIEEIIRNKKVEFNVLSVKLRIDIPKYQYSPITLALGERAPLHFYKENIKSPTEGSLRDTVYGVLDAQKDLNYIIESEQRRLRALINPQP